MQHLPRLLLCLAPRGQAQKGFHVLVGAREKDLGEAAVVDLAEHGSVTWTSLTPYRRLHQPKQSSPSLGMWMFWLIWCNNFTSPV